MRNFAPQAQADLDEAVGWLLDQGFAAAAAEKLLRLSWMLPQCWLRPQIGRYQPDLLPKPFRFWSIPRHSLILVYDPDAEAPTILRVLSTNEEPGTLLEDLPTHSEEAPAHAGKT